ncbi:RGS domain-containing protein [Ilyonectria robusta]|uniref:RGS domain-containing protein n=1 Tax=Ilyonectria robusta TaxID=1079257 RepID=UPI001E8E4802|nr:RGS domain-containing protein [Ilyonectria robusta]KAH8646455.1 RGS domain-containing protein [Ilyonectria robusta]
MSSLASIISDLSPDPWRLNDFTAYLSRNHCLENLQFVQDASRYRVCYAEIVGGNRIPRASLRCHYDYLQALWEGLLSTYIVSHGHREVNLPSDVKKRLLGFSSDFLPHPSELDDAVDIVHQLMEDSILPGFLNSHMSSEQLGERGRGKRRGTSGRDRRKISTSTPKLDYRRKSPANEATGLRTSGLRGAGADGENAIYARRHSIGGTEPSPSHHLLRRTIEVFDHTVRGVRDMRWLKPRIEKDGEADVEMISDQYGSAKSLE